MKASKNFLVVLALILVVRSCWMLVEGKIFEGFEHIGFDIRLDVAVLVRNAPLLERIVVSLANRS